MLFKAKLLCHNKRRNVKHIVPENCQHIAWRGFLLPFTGEPALKEVWPLNWGGYIIQTGRSMTLLLMCMWKTYIRIIILEMLKVIIGLENTWSGRENIVPNNNSFNIVT